MSDALSLTVNQADIEKITAKLKALSPKDRAGGIFKAFQNAGAVLARRLMKNAGGGILRRRSGFLAKSIGAKVTETEDNIIATIGSGVLFGERMKYANIHEDGGIIRPKKGKFLAIPSRFAQTSSGVTRGNPRSFQNTFVAKNTIFQKQGDSIIPLFFLKRSVTIPARHYMSKTLKESKEEINKSFLNALKQAVNK